MSHDPETKAHAVADYLYGDRYKDIMKRYGIGKMTLWRWVRDLHGTHAVASRQRRLDERHDIEWHPPVEPQQPHRK